MVNVHIRQFAPEGAVVDAHAMEQFQRQWGAYQKLVDSDAVSHKAAGRILHEALAAVGRPFSFVDIACGDASLTRAALSGTKVSHYHGIDLAEPAIELAAKNLDGVPYPVELDHEDFVEGLEKRAEPADIAWCGLSIHHLDTAGKLELMKAIRGSTADFLMIYEPSRRDGEDRDTFIKRFLEVHKPLWTMLSEAEWDGLAHHISTADLPETSSGWLDLGGEAGFAEARLLFVDPTDCLRIFRYDV
jgi:hypothetical protein